MHIGHARTADDLRSVSASLLLWNLISYTEYVSAFSAASKEKENRKKTEEKEKRNAFCRLF